MDLVTARSRGDETVRSVERTRPRRRREGLLGRRAQRALVFLVMCLLACVMLYPFYFASITSLRSNGQFIAGSGHSMDSWRHLGQNLPWGRELANSFLVALGAIAIILAVGSMAAYALSRLDLRGSGVILATVGVAMFIPLQSIIIPIYANAARIGLLDNYLGAILVYAALGTPFGVLIMTAFYRRIPGEVVEAGLLDGLGYFGVFGRLMLPLSGPVFATVTVLQFIAIWGDLLVGLLLLPTPDHRTITVGLGVLASGRTTDIPVLMAGSVISGIPAVLVFIALQRYFVRGLVAGAER